MDALPDQKKFIVVYPKQTRTYNAGDCWNWFEPADQARGSGEPAIIAGITRTVEGSTAAWTINTHRVYVAGLSAGAAMSVIMGATYPDIFAAIGVHSGLEYKAATTVQAPFLAQLPPLPNPIHHGPPPYP